MNFSACPREKDLALLLQAGHWPEAAAAELRAHVASCPRCSDLALVRTALQNDRSRQLPLPRLESPGVLWWRAQLRRRNAALQQLNRPLMGAQIFALSVTIIAVAALLLSEGKRTAAWFSGLSDLPRFLHIDTLLPYDLQQSAAAGWLLLSATVILAIAGGVALYIKSEKP